ncbi:MAG TPA: hypothetical protein VH143_35385 [Kofleriaceae bacterium]|nr:hypothetical protein [Kofleriaceae bacterium]
MTDDYSPPPPPAEPMVISPRLRKLGIALGVVLLAAAIFLEQWCHYQSMPHPTSPPPAFGSDLGSAGSAL